MFSYSATHICQLSFMAPRHLDHFSIHYMVIFCSYKLFCFLVCCLTLLIHLQYINQTLLGQLYQSIAICKPTFSAYGYSSNLQDMKNMLFYDTNELVNIIGQGYQDFHK